MDNLSSVAASRKRGAAQRERLASLAMRLVLAAERAVLAQLKPVGVVPPVLARDVVAVLTFLAGQSDLGPDVSRSHCGAPFSRPIIEAAAAGSLSRMPASVVP